VEKDEREEKIGEEERRRKAGCRRTNCPWQNCTMRSIIIISN